MVSVPEECYRPRGMLPSLQDLHTCMHTSEPQPLLWLTVTHLLQCSCCKVDLRPCQGIRLWYVHPHMACTGSSTTWTDAQCWLVIDVNASTCHTLSPPLLDGAACWHAFENAYDSSCYRCLIAISCGVRIAEPASMLYGQACCECATALSCWCSTCPAHAS
jgi:hypothetical protein